MKGKLRASTNYMRKALNAMQVESAIYDYVNDDTNDECLETEINQFFIPNHLKISWKLSFPKRMFGRMLLSIMVGKDKQASWPDKQASWSDHRIIKKMLTAENNGCN